MSYVVLFAVFLKDLIIIIFQSTIFVIKHHENLINNTKHSCSNNCKISLNSKICKKCHSAIEVIYKKHKEEKDLIEIGKEKCCEGFQSILCDTVLVDTPIGYIFKPNTKCGEI